MNNQMASQWQQIVTITEQMQQQVADAAWEEVMSLQLQREKMLNDFFNSGDVSQKPLNCADEIKQLLAMNKEISDSLQNTQHEMADVFCKIMSSKAGISAYTQVSKNN